MSWAKGHNRRKGATHKIASTPVLQKELENVVMGVSLGLPLTEDTAKKIREAVDDHLKASGYEAHNLEVRMEDDGAKVTFTALESAIEAKW